MVGYPYILTERLWISFIREGAGLTPGDQYRYVAAEQSGNRGIRERYLSGRVGQETLTWAVSAPRRGPVTQLPSLEMVRNVHIGRLDGT